ncbi:MAG: hypothetical protein AB1486_18680 [Planctomycetota bacterium]
MSATVIPATRKCDRCVSLMKLRDWSRDPQGGIRAIFDCPCGHCCTDHYPYASRVVRQDAFGIWFLNGQRSQYVRKVMRCGIRGCFGTMRLTHWSWTAPQVVTGYYYGSCGHQRQVCRHGVRGYSNENSFKVFFTGVV